MTKLTLIIFFDKIRKIYNYTTDWEGKHYCGMTLNWNNDKGYVNIFMPQYVLQSLQCLQYKPQSTPQYSPHSHALLKIW